MALTRIKFCGMTCPGDAVAAAEAGANAIGMVFYSKTARHISVEVAAEILAVIPPFMTPVGLFVDSSVDEISHVAGKLGLRTIQLHGSETPELVGRLTGLTVIKSIRSERSAIASVLDQWRQAYRELPPGRLAAILLETAAAEPGGTGIENDWSLLRSLKLDGLLDGLPPLIVAGGLTPANVGAVVGNLRPYAVDVSSGIEETRGVKSITKMQAFVQAVRDADR